MNSLAALIALAVVTPTLPAIWEVKITGVYDGDTFRIEAPQLPSPLDKMKVRVKGIDTPELGAKAKCDLERSKAKVAKLRLQDIVGKADVARLTNYSWDKYGGRVVADVEINGKIVKDIMINEGLAAPYTGQGAKSDWCKQ